MTWVKKEEKEKWRKMNSAAVMFTSRDAMKTDLTVLEVRVWVCSNSRIGPAHRGTRTDCAASNPKSYFGFKGGKSGV